MSEGFHLGHVHLKVRDLDRALAFYRDVFELDVTERYDRYAFLSWGDHHHDVALQAVGADAPEPGPGVGLYHAAVEADSPTRLREVYERLRERGVRVTPVDHGISEALYFSDPDGNGLELYVDTRDDDTEEWSGENRRFDPTER
ncbi:VOC family protein [Halobacterium litoreum]|uniref:VOC family protein n=1 Tax=Halobacterium litoreum TaxID=2039234 RepID=A0ABD5NGN7_9EURY|nr:VOC family protein [Halobacterium litoreum]UHH12810.1 VOC family protein [Halobacterium litoreum]